jgi:hypothetical protein
MSTFLLNGDTAERGPEVRASVQRVRLDAANQCGLLLKAACNIVAADSMDIFWKFGMLRVCKCRAREKKIGR